MQVSLLGDLASLASAFAMAGYLEVGQRLRAWMPLFLYACPVTGEGGIFLPMVPLLMRPGIRRHDFNIDQCLSLNACRNQ